MEWKHAICVNTIQSDRLPPGNGDRAPSEIGSSQTTDAAGFTMEKGIDSRMPAAAAKQTGQPVAQMAVPEFGQDFGADDDGVAIMLEFVVQMQGFQRAVGELLSAMHAQESRSTMHPPRARR